MESVKDAIKDLDKNLSAYQLFNTFHSKTNLPRSYLVYGAVSFYCWLLVVDAGGFGQILCNTVGFIYPSYLSLKALRTITKNDDTELLIYWVVYGFFNVIEFWSKSVLEWIPFYFFFKALFLAFIATPQTGGAKLIYEKLIKQFSEKYIFHSSSGTDYLKKSMK